MSTQTIGARPLPRLRHGRAEALRWGLVVLAVGTIAMRLADIVDAARSHADLVSPLAMAHLLRDLPDSAAMTGNYGWWDGLWLAQLLIRLPGGDALAAYAPLLLTLAAIALLTACAAKLFGWSAAVAVPLVALALAPDTWTFDAAWSARAPTWWAMIGVGVLLTAQRGARTARQRRGLGVATAVVVAWAAVALSGDALALPALLLPTVAVAGVALARRRWRAAAYPAFVAVAVLLGSVLARTVAESAGYWRQSSPVEQADFQSAQGGVGAAVTALLNVWGGNASDVSAAAGYLGGILAIVALAAGTPAVLRWIAGADPEDPSGPVAAWTTFWTSAIVAILVGYAFSTGVVVDGVPAARYLYGLPFAVGALLAFAIPRATPRYALWTPIVLLSVAASVTMIDRAPRPTAEGRVQLLPAIAAVAREAGATRGYASYWSSYPLMARSGFTLPIAPVGECRSSHDRAVQLCPMFLHYVDRAYEPRPGRSFLVVDSGPGSRRGPGSEWVTRPPTRPEPARTVALTPQLEVLIYNHDIAADLGRTTVDGAPLRRR